MLRNYILWRSSVCWSLGITWLRTKVNAVQKGGIRLISFVMCAADVSLYSANTNSVKKTHRGTVRRYGGGPCRRKQTKVQQAGLQAGICGFRRDTLMFSVL